MSGLQILTGDCRAILPTLEAGSVQCCVTSPPYWGLRDYGTAQWAGGDAECEHIESTYAGTRDGLAKLSERIDGRQRGEWESSKATNHQFRNICGRCGARRIDAQLGLESTPEEYIANMVAVFREVGRVLRDDGTLWLNMGDSYASNPASGGLRESRPQDKSPGEHRRTPQLNGYHRPSGLKPKDLCMMPARVALALQADGWYLRSDIIWHKPNPMPESVTDRPTKSHEYIFLLTKSERYFYDAEAIREPANRPEGPGNITPMYIPGERNGLNANIRGSLHKIGPSDVRNKRTVWTIAEPEHVAKCPIDPAIVAALQADGWEIRVEPKPETVDRPTHSHEYIFLLTKSAKYYYDAEAIREPASDSIPWGRRDNVGQYKNNGYVPTNGTLGIPGENGYRNKRSVWTIATQPYAEAHFATFPEEIPKVCVLAGSKPGDTILDPFAGSGTVGKVALELGRRAILIELNPAYIELAQDRTFVTPGFF